MMPCSVFERQSQGDTRVRTRMRAYPCQRSIYIPLPTTLSDHPTFARVRYARHLQHLGLSATPALRHAYPTPSLNSPVFRRLPARRLTWQFKETTRIYDLFDSGPLCAKSHNIQDYSRNPWLTCRIHVSPTAVPQSTADEYEASVIHVHNTRLCRLPLSGCRASYECLPTFKAETI
ncbi:hypothetical protein P152DRAFT_226999 [Eremomyces bilateralis CBS 781.70]|uniref:Uncharacterized protein n=1 Tax=Eremomyces bilateralis CBS 781.70 TaxID=1392243 RepID=A0A6G1FRB2_9PEZI|nr:uncharacterized protein P152DRAFT_226999 [Eremomyces bilateralis CBS 781.70]KAF1808317.1 hypothetical protein P152DRAFT_226999 [Eremomyces bilateralis CBS 781.70]